MVTAPVLTLPTAVVRSSRSTRAHLFPAELLGGPQDCPGPFHSRLGDGAHGLSARAARFGSVRS